MQTERGDVVRSLDPFKTGSDSQRPWLVINSTAHPFGDEQFIGVALTTTAHLPAHPLRKEYWLEGGTPVDSYVLPWSVHSPRNETVQTWQGRLAEEFVDRVVDETVRYLR